MAESCNIVPVGKRRDGKMRYWCQSHHASALGPKGVRLERCLKADAEPISPTDVLKISPDQYPGGIALWGAVPAVYSTATHDMPALGIHVHARRKAGGVKQVDRTFRRVIVKTPNAGAGEVELNEEDAVYYMVSLVFNKEMKTVICPHCGHSHLDKDWFAVHPHKKHLCAGCGRHFSDVGPGIGNPLIEIKAAFSDSQVDRTTVSPKRELTIRQAEFQHGIELWGSNQAIIWTSPKLEESGIHVHAYSEDRLKPAIDDTFDRVIIDGTEINETQLRALMAQQSLPHLSGRIVSLNCPNCRAPHFDIGEEAIAPHIEHTCHSCSHHFTSPLRLKKVISNPMIDVLRKLEECSILPRQIRSTNLRPEV